MQNNNTDKTEYLLCSIPNTRQGYYIPDIIYYSLKYCELSVVKFDAL